MHRRWWRVLQPELSAAQKASLLRFTRINSISRYEAGDSRARCVATWPFVNSSIS